jgi:hypothetical protein
MTAPSAPRLAPPSPRSCSPGSPRARWSTTRTSGAAGRRRGRRPATGGTSLATPRSRRTTRQARRRPGAGSRHAGPATPDAGPADGATLSRRRRARSRRRPTASDAGEPGAAGSRSDGGPTPPDAGEPDGGEQVRTPPLPGIPACPLPGRRRRIEGRLLLGGLPGGWGRRGERDLRHLGGDVWAVGFADMGAAAWHRSGPTAGSFARTNRGRTSSTSGLGSGGTHLPRGESGSWRTPSRAAAALCAAVRGARWTRGAGGERGLHRGWGTTATCCLREAERRPVPRGGRSGAAHVHDDTTLACSGPFSSAPAWRPASGRSGRRRNLPQGRGPGLGELRREGDLRAWRWRRRPRVGPSAKRHLDLHASSSAADCTQSSTVTGCSRSSP